MDTLFFLLVLIGILSLFFLYKTGSWYITELCQTLCEFSMVMDLDEIQKEVNERVVKKYTHLGHKQQPRGIDQLRKKVYFFSNNN